MDILVGIGIGGIPKSKARLDAQREVETDQYLVARERQTIRAKGAVQSSFSNRPFPFHQTTPSLLPQYPEISFRPRLCLRELIFR